VDAQCWLWVQAHLPDQRDRAENLTVVLTIATVVIVTITCIARSDKQSSEYVWATFDNSTGWPGSVTFFFVVNAVQQTAAHLIWAFGRDRGLVFATEFVPIHSRLGVPVWGLLANASLVALAGILFLVSTAALNALTNSCIVLQVVSFAIPCILLMVRKRSSTFLPETRSFYLPAWLGWTCNLVAVIAAVVQMVLFDSPGAIPVSGSLMSEWPDVASKIDRTLLPVHADALQITSPSSWPSLQFLVDSTG